MTKSNPKGNKVILVPGYLVREWLQTHALLQEYTYLLPADLKYSQSHNHHHKKQIYQCLWCSYGIIS